MRHEVTSSRPTREPVRVGSLSGTLATVAAAAASGAVGLVLSACGSTPAASAPIPPATNYPNLGGVAGTRTDHPHDLRTVLRFSRASTTTSTSTTSTTTTSTTSTTTTVPAPAAGLVPGRVTVIGDSVTVDAAPSLQAIISGCVVDAGVGEQWTTGVQVAQQLRSTGQLGADVVIALGTNGTVTAADFQQMMAVLAGVSRVVFVTDHAPQPWEASNNAIITAEAAQYPNARVADWDAAARANPSWMYSDGTHMPSGGPGAQAFAALVRAQL